MEKEESGQWESIYNSMFYTIPPTLRDPTCEKLIELYSKNYSLEPIDTFVCMSEGVKTIKEKYIPDLFVSMGYMAAYLLGARDTAIMMCRQYCELNDVRHTSQTLYRFIVEDASIRDALFDKYGFFMKPHDIIPSEQGMQ